MTDDDVLSGEAVWERDRPLDMIPTDDLIPQLDRDVTEQSWREEPRHAVFKALVGSLFEVRVVLRVLVPALELEPNPILLGPSIVDFVELSAR